MSRSNCPATYFGFVVAFFILCAVHAQQRPTIPEAMAKGAVNSVATVPSGPVPTVADLLRITDVLVIGTIGEPRSYLSADERDVYTDYTLKEPEVLFRTDSGTTATPGTVPVVTVTQRGGTIAVNGTKFTQSEPALAPLRTGTRGLFLLQRIHGQYHIAGTFYGVFAVADGRLMPLAERQDFGTEYRNAIVSGAVGSMIATLRSRRTPPR